MDKKFVTLTVSELVSKLPSDKGGLLNLPVNPDTLEAMCNCAYEHIKDMELISVVNSNEGLIFLFKQ